jgi:NADH:ubiquinone oxidoreductase subunit 3 (subunit A)
VSVKSIVLPNLLLHAIRISHHEAHEGHEERKGVRKVIRLQYYFSSFVIFVTFVVKAPFLLAWSLTTL